MQIQSEMFQNVSGMREVQDKWDFSFDRVFGGQTSQRVVFEEISQLVKSALDGYKVAIFAYGQTGGGKTYTMEGPPIHTLTNKQDFELKAGMIPRAVHLIFQHIARANADAGWVFSVKVSFVEIYNESIR